MKKIILLIVTFGINYTNAQTGNPDSIKLLLQNAKDDTSRVLHLADLSFEYLESKPDTMMILALQALELSRRIGFLKGEALSLNRVGNAYGSFSNYPKGMEVYLQALQINEKINNLAESKIFKLLYESAILSQMIEILRLLPNCSAKRLDAK